MISIELPGRLIDIEYRKARAKPEVQHWCNEHIGGRVVIEPEWLTRHIVKVWVYFERDADFIAFKLAWL